MWAVSLKQQYTVVIFVLYIWREKSRVVFEIGFLAMPQVSRGAAGAEAVEMFRLKICDIILSRWEVLVLLQLGPFKLIQ